MTSGSLVASLTLLLLAILANGQFYGGGSLQGPPGRSPGGGGGQFAGRRPQNGPPVAYPGGAYPVSNPGGSRGDFREGLSTGARLRTCKEHTCPFGTRCVAAVIPCVRSPCYPIITCVS
ncbi:uncharacterized protein ISCGN_011458 [Ixodes scapularis]